ncbi:hypothetical protein RFI_33533, partial [Reticulomyxa filosa]
MADEKQPTKEENDWDCQPVPRNYFREQQQQQVRTFTACSSLDHPLSRMHEDAIAAIHKTNKSKGGPGSSLTSPKEQSSASLSHTSLTANTNTNANANANANANTNASSKEEEDDMDLLFNPKSSTKEDPLSSVPQKGHDILDPLTAASMGLDDSSLGISFSNVNKTASDSIDNANNNNNSSNNNKASIREQETMHKEFEGWKAKRDDILRKYTSNKQIKVTAKFLDEGTANEDGKQQSEEDHLKQRVGQLGPEGDDPNAALMLSQAEYIKRM